MQFFNDRKEVVLTANVLGAARPDEEFDGEDPLDTYMRLIRQRGLVLGGEEDASLSVLAKQPKSVYKPRRILTIISESQDD